MSESAAAEPTTPAPGPATPTRSRQGSMTSGMPPKTPLSGAEGRSRQGSFTSQAQAVSKQGSRMSLKESVGGESPPVNPPSAGAASGSPAVTSPVAPPSEHAAIVRQGSQVSARSQGTAKQSAADAPVSEPAREGTPEGSAHSERAATPLVQSSSPAQEAPRDVETELAEAKNRIYSLEQQNASLQRLMSSSSGDTKIKMMTQDLNKRSERIKALEAEVKKQTKRAEEAEAKARVTTKERRMSRSSMNVSEKGSAQDKAVIKELQTKLQETEAKLNEVQRQDRPVSFSVGGQDAQATIFKLQTLLAEREAANQLLEQKLARAQAAIVSSAGAGFENEVKLQQAKSALQSILRSQSPQHSTRAPSQPLRGGSASPMSHPASPSLTQYPSSRPKAYYETLANPYSSLTSYSAVSQPRSVSPTRRYAVPQY
eukprot:TRINITY_DN16647_c0_g2_i2.p1 TRINITY_DN16647_c0_g2~~TRINITY_DN16647_c0_g2_i2.p1  ORF type:complete len:443 (+),score=103.40 TRINITY_DN16647_c0_g2_i2:46-1329(+)